MNQDQPTTYTTYGSVRGDCGHRHQTFEAALQCAERDQRACRRRGGYSDRRVYAESEVQRNLVGDVYRASAQPHDGDRERA